MIEWPAYDSSLFVDRPAMLGKLRRWAQDPAGNRVMALIGSPGSGKSWLLQRLQELLSDRQLTLWLNAPALLQTSSENNAWEQILAQDAFENWLSYAQQTACRFCRHFGQIALIPSAEARIDQLARKLSQCNLTFPPLLLVDSYDEITDNQATMFSLHFLDRFLSSPSTRILVAARSQEVLRGEVLRRDIQYLCLANEERIQKRFVQEQFERWLKRKFPNQSLPENKDWIERFQHYSWCNPAFNYALFELAWKGDPPVLQPLQKQDFQEVIQDVVTRDQRHPELSSEELTFLQKLATLPPLWSSIDAERQ
ncbi:MAG: AAA family ATPase, partial [Candidatus Methanomethylicaceae archaeon]